MPRILAQATTSSTSEVALNATTYTEQTSGAQRSVLSSSASDAAAGTGARTVKITYYALASDGTMTGPFSETVTLNGTAAVGTVATNIALIERFEILTVGSGGVSVGTISLNTKGDGTGTTFCSIAIADPRAWLGHHYVASKRQCKITDVNFLGGVSTAALFKLKVLSYPGTNALEAPLLGPVGASNAASQLQTLQDWQHSPVVGPARVRIYVAPGTSGSQTSYGNVGYVDEVGLSA
jgi:hypothetical protein